MAPTITNQYLELIADSIGRTAISLAHIRTLPNIPRHFSLIQNQVKTLHIAARKYQSGDAQLHDLNAEVQMLGALCVELSARLSCSISAYYSPQNPKKGGVPIT